MIKETVKKYLPVLKPSFVVIGAQKGGTTSFYEYLNFHPLFRKAQLKEVHYFDLNYNNGDRWYHRQFPKALPFSGKFTGEASPYYLFHPLVAERVYRYLPQMKIVCLLREPVERAYSQYCMNVKTGEEWLSFEEAVKQEVTRLAGEEVKIKQGTFYNSYNYQTYSYIGRGRYIEQIERWYKLFPRNQFLFIRSTDFKSDSAKELNRFCDFMNISRFVINKTLQLNSYSDPKLNAETKEKLTDYFKPYNQQLFNLTGININE